MFYRKPPQLCPVCKEKADFKFIQNYKNREGKWSLFECSKCNVQFWMPFKNPGIVHYERNYIVRDTLKPKILYGYHKKFLKTYEKFSVCGKVLDLGCGTGDLIAILKQKGCKVWGVDLDKNAINFAKKYFKLENVYPISCEEFFTLENIPRFDLITAFELLEHLDNPLNFLQNIKNLLKKEGIAVISTPSRERILPNLWPADFPPHHLTRWNEKAIFNLFEKVGFEIIRIDYTDQLKFLMESLNSKLRLGLVLKTARISKHKKINKEEKVIVGGTFLTELVHFGAYLKDYFLTGLLAILILAISKILGYKNGDMVIWCKKRT